MPITIERRFHGTPREYHIYTREEADREGIDYAYWHEVQPGQWALTDDDYVAECIRRNTYADNGSEKDHIVLSFGEAWHPGTPELRFTRWHEAGTYGGTSPRTWAEREAGKERTRRAVQVYVAMMITTGEVDWDVVGRAYRPDEELPAVTVRRLFKQDRIKELAQQELRSALESEGVTERDAVRLLAEAKKEVMKEGGRDVELMLKVYDRLNDLHGLTRQSAPSY